MLSFVVMLVAFGLLLVLGKRGKGAPWWLKAGLCAIAGASLAQTGFGSWLAAQLRSVAGLLGSIGGVSGGLVAAGIALILVVIVIYDIAVDKKADKPAKIGLIILPLLFMAAVGPVAEGGNQLMQAVAEFGTNSIGRLIGG